MAMGRELFHREWTPGDPRRAGGDGLGPVYNESSCVACHNLGGSGGGGPVNKNVDLVSSPTGSGRPLRLLPSAKPAAVLVDPKNPSGLFANAPSVVLHRFGVEPDFAPWRVELLGTAGVGRGRRPGNVAPDAPIELARAELASARLGDPLAASRSEFVRSQRNPSALFGAGLIDAIPEATIVGASERRDPKFPSVTGRVSRISKGRCSRPVRLEGADGDARGFRPDGLLDRAGPGRPRSRPGRRPARPRPSRARARPRRRRLRRPGRLRPRPGPTGRGDRRRG